MPLRLYPRLLKGFLWLWFGLGPLICAGHDSLEQRPFTLQRFTESEGLVSSETTDTYRDGRGFLWVATFGGISRFDGRTFENFGRANGFTESNLDIVGEDAAGQLFAKSVSSIYQYTGSKIQSFVKYPTSGKFIQAACPARKGQVWVAYDGTHGLHLLAAGGEVGRLATEAPVYQLLAGSSGDIYVLEYSGRLSLLKGDTLVPFYTIQPSAPYTNEGIKIYKDARGRLWSYGANNRYIYAHSGTRLTDSLAIPKGTRWWQWFVGSSRQLYQASDTGSVALLTGGRWQVLLTREQLQGHPYSVWEDRGGTLWVASSGGLLRLRPKHYRSTAANAPVVYYAADSKGRYTLRSDSGLFRLPGALASFNALQLEGMTHIYITRKQEVWFCTEDAVYYLPYRRRLQKLNTTGTYEGGKAAFRFRRVLESAGGGLWISSYHGIFHHQGERLQYYWDREGLREGAIYTIAEDKQAIFYAAGVHVYALQKGRFVNISGALDLDDEISRLATDQGKNVWVCQGTDRITRIGYSSQRGFYAAEVKQLSLNGLPFSATSIAFDDRNNLWVCDNRSLYCYPVHNGRYADSPLYFNENLTGSPHIYPGAGDELQVFSPSLAANYLRTYATGSLLAGYEPEVPVVHLTGLALYKEAFDWQKAGFATDVFGVPKDLALQHDQNFVTFAFTGITDDYQSNIAYRYRLRGYDKGWSPVSESPEAEYTGLPPGRYTFEVQGRSAGGAWSDSRLYPFEVQAVWWATGWVKLLWALLLLGGVGGLIYWRTAYLRGKAFTRQLLVEEQLKALRAQINPHFMQNIFTFLAHELYASHNVRAVKAIEGLAAYLRDVLRYSDKAALTLEEELELAEEYLQLQQQLLSTPFRYTVLVDEEVDTFDLQVPSMILQPLIENALKYGLNPKGENQIAVRVSTTNQYLRCVVSDSGRGGTGETSAFPGAGNGKGLVLTQERMNLFYQHKKRKPHLLPERNAAGGWDVTLLIPIE